MKKRKSILLLCVVVLLLLCILVNSIVGVPKDLSNALVEYLEECNSYHDLEGYSWEQQIDFIKNGGQALHIAFDPSEYYFVCGYYNSTHEGDELGSHCCAKKYTWIKFGSADKIRESYFGKELVVTFQMNKALFTKDLLTDKACHSFKEHFQIYTPQFVDGLNTNTAVSFSETFIYLNRYGKSNLYYSTSHYNHQPFTLSCISIEEQYYIPIHTHTVSSDGEFYDYTDYNMRMFGKYYVEIESIMETGRYSIENETSHSVRHYGLVSVEDFANEIIK